MRGDEIPGRGGDFPGAIKSSEFEKAKKLTESEREIYRMQVNSQRDREKRSEFLHCGMTGVLHVSTPTGILHEGDSK